MGEYVYRNTEGSFVSFHLGSFSGGRTISSTVKEGYIFVAHVCFRILLLLLGTVLYFFEQIIHACINFVFVKFIGHMQPQIYSFSQQMLLGYTNSVEQDPFLRS
jgi:hypothetical protein